MAPTLFFLVLTALSTTLSFGQNTDHPYGKSEENVSDLLTMSEQSMFVPQIPEECEKASYCEKTLNYPHEYVDALLAKLSDKGIKLEHRKLPQDTVAEEPTGDEPLKMDLCNSESKNIYPDAVKTTNGKWVFVLNGKNLKIHGYRVVVCTNPNTKCDEVAMFPSNYSGTCKQRYIQEFFLALDSNGEIKQKDFSLPSCCICDVQPV